MDATFAASIALVSTQREPIDRYRRILLHKPPGGGPAMIFFSLLVALYFLPTFIAAHRGHPVGAIFLLNLLFGWTGIGWFAMVLFSLLALPRYRFYTPVVMPGARYAAWERF